MNFFITRSDPSKKKEIGEDDISLLTLNKNEKDNTIYEQYENKEGKEIEKEKEKEILNIVPTENHYFPKTKDVLYFSVTESFRFFAPSDVKVLYLPSDFD